MVKIVMHTGDYPSRTCKKPENSPDLITYYCTVVRCTVQRERYVSPAAVLLILLEIYTPNILKPAHGDPGFGLIYR
jgi:hypothetical protein